MKIDPSKTWQAVEKAYEAETRPRPKQLLKEVRNHMKTEVCGDLDGLMATLTAEPQYHMWGTGPENGPKGREAVYAFYSQMIDGGGNLFEFNVERIFADDNGVITEGTLRNAYPGEAILAAGITEVNGEPVDAAAKYCGTAHLLTVWPADPDGKLVGEDIFFGSSPFAQLDKLAPEDEPQPVSLETV
ncbi:MAG: nuclear transport factor 2 family protein [Alphaproteobacteria bacterium]